MNQQSGMEADKEIDRFLQKVKKRDMRQKSILLLGMYALVGSILGFWYSAWRSGIRFIIVCPQVPQCFWDRSQSGAYICFYAAQRQDVQQD